VQSVVGVNCLACALLPCRFCSLQTCGAAVGGTDEAENTDDGDPNESSAGKGDFSQHDPVSMFLIVPNIANCAHC